jgi:hypothetical protein
MPEFEEILKVLVMFGGFMGIIIASGFGFKKLGRKSVADPEVSDRLSETEARIGELEERLDFSERALADLRARIPLPPGP